MQSQSGRCQTSETTDLVLLWKTAGLPSGSYVRDRRRPWRGVFVRSRGSRGLWAEWPGWGDCELGDVMGVIGSTTDLEVPPGLASSLSFLQEMGGRGSGSRSQKVLPHPYTPPTRSPWPGPRSGAGLTLMRL